MSYSYADDSRFPGPDPYAPLKDLPEFPLTSTDLEEGTELPEQLRAPSSVSPQLSWSDLPAGTKSLAVTCFDPDAPTASGFWHWAAFDIPVDVTELPSNAGAKEDLASGRVRWPTIPASAPITAPPRRPATRRTVTCMRCMPWTWRSWTSRRTPPPQSSGSTCTSTPSAVPCCGAGTKPLRAFSSRGRNRRPR